MAELGSARHRYEPHTGELQLHLEGPTLVAVFVEASRALAELMLDSAARVTPAQAEPVTVHAADRAALLVEWLNELIFRSEVKKCVYTDIQISSLSDRVLHATIAGIPVEGLRTQPKAATLHGLDIHEEAGRWVATVVIDV